MSGPVCSIDEIIEIARRGEPFILVDADDRENEGDIVIPAEFATPAAINFMATHARGLICLAMTGERAAELSLAPVTSDNRTSLGTAFTTSIEAREGVTTGISVHDRARTISVAVDPAKGRADIVSPGHVFPLIARKGGVLVRAGHTEAAVDIARIAGLNPSGVICEIMNDDGTMARMPDLVRFAEQHGLKIGTIADLIAYRRRSEVLVSKVLEGPFTNCFARDFRIHIYCNDIDGSEHVALVRGEIDPDEETLVRVHRFDFVSDCLGARDRNKGPVDQALQVIGDHVGPAVAVFVQDAAPPSLTTRLLQAEEPQQAQLAIKDYGIGAQILRDLGVRNVRLLSSNKAKLAALAGFGLSVRGRVPFAESADGPRRSASLGVVNGR